MDEQSKSERIIDLAQKLGVLRPKDLVPQGIQAEYLRRLCDKGTIKKVGRGSYVLADSSLSPSLSLAIIGRAVPNGVVCLQSALAYHGIGTQSANEVFVAIERRAARPRVDYPEVRVARLGGPAFTDGVETHAIENVKVKIYSLEKTLADLFKFRNKIGPQFAVDDLRTAMGERSVNMKKLWHFAKLCRVERVMKPYVDALA
ncbi:MAG: type IV toxin-antitoxin system AbiEi family antitoxin domain-containing protein [Stenotrophobium sp.]